MSEKLYYFTPVQLEEIKTLYPVTKAKDLAKQYDCSTRKIYNLAQEFGLKKDKEWIRENARKNFERPDHPAKSFHFPKGHVPENKGKKQTDYMSPESIERTKGTQFKKGQLGWNHKEVGYERINADGYIEVKVSEPRTFKLKQRHVWEMNFGTIPKGHNIQFKDKNSLNCEPENLYMISRRDQLKTENSMYARYPKELQLAIQAKGALNRQINKLIQQENEH